MTLSAVDRRGTVVALRARIAGAALLLAAGAAFAQGAAHEAAKGSLVHLRVTGTPQSGPQTGEDGGVESQGTGFFVSADGFLLTTRHLFAPLARLDAVNIEITGRIGDAESRPLRVQLVSELPLLDLALLRADIPFDTPPPRPLEIGSTIGIDAADPPPLLTSGFQNRTLRHKKASLNDTESEDVPYAWTLDVKSVDGQSGSPVYTERADGTVAVVGVLKATSRHDDELTLMIPIEYSMPLIGHLKLQELADRIAALERAVGEPEIGRAVPGHVGNEPSPPLSSRVGEIEGHVEEIGSHFIWDAKSRPDGSIVVRYDKILRGGAQVDRVDVKITPYMRVRSDENIEPGESPDIITVPTQTLRLPDGGRIERTSLDETTGTGTFVVRDVGERLKTLSDLSADALRGTETFRDIRIALLPHVGDQPLPTKELVIVPDFDWANFGANL